MLYFTANKLTIKPCLKHLANELHLFGCCGEIRSAPFATTFARITSASCAAASRTSHNN